ncbi:MAG: hypothetical protein DI629_05375 [Mesorhizobium amorphae]|nr:MAG: hypothetical protein DI629_05375 [Mesorhizobium amorphae]
MSPSPASRVLACLLLASAAAPATGQEFASNLSARVVLADAAGKPIEHPAAGSVFRVEVRIDDALSTSPAADLPLEGWIRPVEETNLPCNSAVQSFRATRRLPTGSIDLNGSFLVTVNEDASFGVVDPRFDLASANLLKAGRLKERPASVAVNEALQTAYFALAESGEIVALTLPSGDLRPFRSGLGSPFKLMPAGASGLWVAERSPPRLRLLAPDGRQSADVVAGPGALLVAGSENGPIMAATSDGRTKVARRADGGILADFAGPAGASAIALAGMREDGAGATAAAFLDASGTHVDLRYLDDPRRSLGIALPFPANALHATPDGRHLFALDGAHHLSIVDLALSRVVQGVVFNKPVREMVFAGRTAVFLYRDTSAAAVLDLSTIREGQGAILKEVRLGAPSESAGDARLLLALPPSEQALAVHQESRAGFVIDEHSMAIGAPPMSAVSLRGGVPFSVTLAPRGFREERPGRYVTTAAIASPGSYELVLTTGIGGLSACVGFAVPGEARTDRPVQALVKQAGPATPLRAGKRGRLEFTLVAPDGRRIETDRAKIVLQALGFSMRKELSAVRNENGLAVSVEVPHPGPYVMQVRAGPGIAVAPFVLEVSR